MAILREAWRISLGSVVRACRAGPTSAGSRTRDVGTTSLSSDKSLKNLRHLTNGDEESW